MVMSQSLFGQLIHAFPPLPHCPLFSEVSWMQALPLQQPLPQEAGVHTHEPPWHTKPAPHAVHAAPPVPHASMVSDMLHCPKASQQPIGHDFASQTHCPAPLHSWPMGHAAHATPFAPHAMFDSLPIGSHEPALQQPLHAPPPHVHAPPEHAWPAPQGPHALPPEPHLVVSWLPIGTHVFPEQQPPEHDDGVHVHVPLVVSQTWPGAQEAHAAPPLPHEGYDSPANGSHVPVGPPLQQPSGHDVASQTHAPPLQCLPAAQAGPPLHVHCPLVHALVVIGSHAAHVPPLVPHDPVDCEPSASQVPGVPPTQHPVAQVLASQEQVPLVVSQSPLEQVPQLAPPVPHWDAFWFA
jgi:hypothetical protein